MELKAGYKQTEVGVLPEEWEVSTVGREFSVQLGKMLDAERNFGVAKPYLGNKAVQWGQIDTSNLPTVPMTRSDLDKFRLQRGDLLVCEGGEVGRAAIWEAPLDECYYQKALHRLRPLREFDPRLMVAVLQQLSVRGFLGNYVTQTSIAHLPRDKFVEVLIPRPPLPEQRAIATALSDMDALRSGLDRLIAKKRDLKQAAMQQLLTGKTRLPGFHGEWKVLLAHDIGKFKGGSGFPLDDQGGIGGEYPFFKVSDMNNEGNETFITTANHYVSEDTRKRLGATAFPADSIVFAKVGAAVFLERKKILGQASCIDNNMAAFILDKSRADVRYTHSLLLSKKLGALVSTTALPALNAKQLGEIQLAIPPLPEQTAIAEVLSDMDVELAALEQRRNKIRDLMQAMLQELLTGKTRLVPAGAPHG